MELCTCLYFKIKIQVVLINLQKYLRELRIKKFEWRFLICLDGFSTCLLFIHIGPLKY